MTTMRTVLDHPGPFATVHLDASRDHENAEHELELRWRTARRELADADADTLAALEEAVLSSPASAGRLLVGAGGEVLLNQPLPDPPSVPVTRWAPLPYLMPLVESAGQVPHVAVLVDKTGADLRAVDANGEVRTEQAQGRDHPVHKVRGGGWAHLNIQQHTEETVHRNIRMVVEELTRLVDEVHARLLVVAGEEQVLGVLTDDLPSRCQALLAHAPGRREAPEEFEHAVAELARKQARTEHDELLDRFHAALRADRGFAAQGLSDTIDALRQHNAEAVVLGDLADTTLWFSRESQSIATTEDELRTMGATDPVPVRADELLPDYGLRVDAEVITTDEPLIDGVGVLHRHR
jgi:hypothetical protein